MTDQAEEKARELKTNYEDLPTHVRFRRRGHAAAPVSEVERRICFVIHVSSADF